MRRFIVQAYGPGKYDKFHNVDLSARQVRELPLGPNHAFFCVRVIDRDLKRCVYLRSWEPQGEIVWRYDAPTDSMELVKGVFADEVRP